MDIFRFSTNLRLHHPTMSPDEISTALGMTPKRAWQVGHERVTPNGMKLEGVYRDTYWSSSGRSGEDSQLLDTMDSDLSQLEGKKAFLDTFVATGGRVTYYISWFASDRSGGSSLSWSLLEKLAELKIDLALDVYSHREEETPQVSSRSDISLES